MKQKLKLGDKLFRLNIGNTARCTPQHLSPVIVVALGRKYVTCVPEGESIDGWRIKYHLDSWVEAGDNASYMLYSSPQEWEDAKEAVNISKAIYAAFEDGMNRLKLPIESLRAIARTIKLGKASVARDNAQEN